MSALPKSSFKDDWLVQALIYYQIIDQALYDELSQRFAEEEYFFDILVQNNYLQPNDIALFIENAMKIPTVDLEKIQINEKLIELIPEEVCRKYLVIPFSFTEKQISIGSFNASNLDAESKIEQLTGKYVKTYFAFKEQIETKISEYYSPDKIIDSLVDGQKKTYNVQISGVDAAGQKDSSVVRLVNQVLSGAIDDGASDIHIEPKEQHVSIRYRIDGVLRNIMDVPRSIQSTLISRIKIISSLNIAETRKPQDGKAKISVDDVSIDLRVSILPTSFGEKAVIRILDKRKAMVSFEHMGIRGRNKEYLEKCFEFKQGMVLVTGPTGSGKSTTLYAAINRVRSTANNILTIEDPIEYMMEGINQVQVNEKAGITFSSALRSFLRQDPDVILVGEIRDKETAEIAIQAALTGHLVLSTLHTNDTFATITRLKDMGVDKFKITESLQAIIAQRLVRRLCVDCKEQVQAKEVDPQLAEMLHSLGYSSDIHKAKGCSKCNFSGYKGRIGVYEILILNSTLKDMINNDASLQKIRSVAKGQGFRNLFEDAISLISEGITDYKEILRTIHSGAQAGLDISKQEDGMADDKQNIAIKTTDSRNASKKAAKNVLTDTDSKKGHNNNPVILIVEDSKIARKMIRTMLEKSSDYSILEADDGLKALKKLSKTIPDLILLDLMMPNMDGYELLQHVRSEPSLSRIPVLILTGLKSTESEIKGYELGADGYLTKPIQKSILLARINRILKQKESSGASRSDSPLKTEQIFKPDIPAIQTDINPNDNNENEDINFKLI